MNQTQKQPTRHTTATDGLFGMMLATAFLGVAYGDGVADACRTGENVAAVCEDRRTNGNFKLGVKKSLAGDFTRLSQGFEETIKPMAMQYMPSPAPAPALRAA